MSWPKTEDEFSKKIYCCRCKMLDSKCGVVKGKVYKSEKLFGLFLCEAHYLKRGMDLQMINHGFKELKKVGTKKLVSYSCDRCEKTIKGKRYKHLSKTDYDLCKSCFETRAVIGQYYGVKYAIYNQDGVLEDYVDAPSLPKPVRLRGRIAPMHLRPQKVTHANICDNCNQTIVGIRYKSLACTDYDLCQTCFPSRKGFGAYWGAKYAIYKKKDVLDSYVDAPRRNHHKKGKMKKPQNPKR